MSDSFTEVSSQGWLGRIGSSIKGILVGMLLCGISVVVLFWNEGRAVQTAKGLDEGLGAVVSASADKVESANNQQLVHISGKAITDDVLHDEEFHVEQNAIRLVRLVEMYQWKEDKDSDTRKKVGGGTETVTTYTYEETWSSSLIDSNSFNQKHRSTHQNPDTMPVQAKTLHADKVTVGAYRLSPSLRNMIENAKDVEVSAENIPETLTERMQLQGSQTLYLGTNPNEPQIGDCRISFSVTLPADVSVVAQQTGDSFQPYQTKAGDALDMLRMGTVGADQMFAMAQAENTQLTWILRGVGAVLMFIGLMLITKPISVLADVLPFLGDLVEMGLGLVAGLLTITGSCLVIGFAWVFYRPLIGVPLLLLALGAIVMLFLKRPRRSAAA
jgi:hypothetical protein